MLLAIRRTEPVNLRFAARIIERSLHRSVGVRQPGNRLRVARRPLQIGDVQVPPFNSQAQRAPAICLPIPQRNRPVPGRRRPALGHAEAQLRLAQPALQG